MGEWERKGSGGRVREWGKGREKGRGGEGNGDEGREWGMREGDGNVGRGKDGE